MILQKNSRSAALSGSRAWGQIAVFLLPPLAALIFLFILPIALTIAYSFWTVNNCYLLVREATLVNYERLPSDPLYRNTLLGSVWMAFLTTVFYVLLALPLAWFIARRMPEK